MHGSASSPEAASSSSSSVAVEVESRTSVVTAPSLGQTFSLPKDGDALSLVSNADAHALKLHLSADLALVGANSRRVAFSTHKLFGEMLNTLQASGASHAARSDEEFTRAFHAHLTAVLLNQTNVQLIRSPSMEHLLQEVASAEGLLSQGIEPYLSAMRRVLRQAVLDAHSVQVVLSEYSYSVPRAGGGRNGGKSDNKPTTVGSLLAGLFCFPVLIPKYLYERQTALREPLLGSESKEIRVLSDVTCLIRPARLTLVLGPPGSGKTSLLRAMSGKLLSKPTSGELQYNGRPVDELHNLANWSAYVSQNDEHMPLLTVRETITHAFKCRKEIRFRAAEHGLPQAQRDMLEAYRQLEVDVFLAVLGLARCADTIIGNETLKGISGGEKRRVTLGEMLAVGSQVLCLDEISTGLDSAATFDICQYLRHVAHLMDTCVVVALLQPAPEVMDLFDDILVIAEGQIIFHGERHACLPYFESLGFHRPDSKDIADFIQELPTPGGLREFRLSDADLSERGITQLPPNSVSELVHRWKHSALYRQEKAEVQRSLHRTAGGAQGGDIDSLPQNSWSTQLRLAMSWSWMVRMKNKTKLRAKLIQNVFMGLLLGTLFFQIPSGEAYRKNILFFQVLMISGQSAITEVQTNVKARSIYHKHVDQHFYSAWMLSLAQTLTTIPVVVADTAIFGQLIYWLTGLSHEIWHFALFCLSSVLYGCAMQSIMGTFPYLFRDEMTSTGGAGLFLLVSCLLGGTIATTDVIPSYLLPLYWANPLAYAVRMLANIEYLSPSYDDNPCVVELNGRSITIPLRCGDFYLKSRQISEGWAYVHQGMQVLVGCLVVFWLITTLALTYVRFDPIPAEKKKLVVEGGDGATYSSLGHSSVVAPRQVTLAVYKLGYTITRDAGEEMDLLSGVSMWARPGRMLALMGSSGAGKTTLLDVLAGVKSTGKVRGRVFLNGKPSTRSDFNNLAGYVQQFGIHNERSTVRESLLFSMRLRLGETDAHVQNKFLEEILALLELDSIQDIYCGQCSMEQNKRLTMGVELVANPSVIFADEPTSSLDARAAQIVIRVLKRVAASGRTVIATIHQPSVEIFNQFDDLLLLKTGGKVAYFGEVGVGARTMVSYFEGFSFAPFDYDNAGTNPAAWMLDVIGGGTGLRKKANEDVDFADVYSQSELCQANEQRLLGEFGIAPELLAHAHVASTLERYNAVFKTSMVWQFYLVLHRNLQTLWRSPEFTLMQVAVVVMFGLMFVSLFYQQEMSVMADVQSRILCITFSMSMASMNLMMALVPFLMNRRALFYREHSSGMYHSSVFVLAFGAAQLPSLIVNAVISVNIVYFGVGYNQTSLFPYAYYMGSSTLFMMVLTAFGMFVSCALPEPLSAQLAASVFFNVMNVFAGIPVPIKAMPVQYKWIHYVSPMRWFYEGILSTQFHGNHEIICNPLGIPVTDKIMGKLHLCTSTGKADWHKVTGVQVEIESYVLDDFLWGYRYAHKWDDLAVLVAWVLGLVLLTLLATKYISYDNR